MKWVKDGKTWYSADVIKKIEKHANIALAANCCNRCDGVGYYEGCMDINCATYQMNKIMDIIEGEQ